MTMATLTFCDFDDALDALTQASSEAVITSVIDQLNRQFEAETLEVTPTNWAHLSSAVMVATARVRVVSGSVS